MCTVSLIHVASVLSKENYSIHQSSTLMNAVIFLNLNYHGALNIIQYHKYRGLVVE